MVTIADILNDIQILQDEILSTRMEQEAIADSTFIGDPMTFTTVQPPGPQVSVVNLNRPFG